MVFDHILAILYLGDFRYCIKLIHHIIEDMFSVHSKIIAVVFSPMVCRTSQVYLLICAANFFQNFLQLIVPVKVRGNLKISLTNFLAVVFFYYIFLRNFKVTLFCLESAPQHREAYPGYLDIPKIFA